MKIPILVLVFTMFGSIAIAQESPCDDEKAIYAVMFENNLANWDDIYNSYKKFYQCDDGALAEAYSDYVVRMLAYHWDQLDRLINLKSKNEKFWEFILMHIDATTDDNDLKVIIKNCETKCPDSDKTLCETIGKAAKKALQEIEEIKP